MDTNATPTTVTTYYTNIFCITTNVITNVPSATPGRDYFPMSGQLVFNDYQMSADILVSVFPNYGFRFPVLNHVVMAYITNVALDPLESTTIPAAHRFDGRDQRHAQYSEPDGHGHSQ